LKPIIQKEQVMKKHLIPATLALSAMLLCGGCVGGLNLGGGSKTEVRNPTLGQQLIDLQKARDSGAITPAEYDAKKAELLSKR
jgi:hypothetical protein